MLPQRILKNKISVLKELCKRYEVKKMYFFGSICANNFNKDSDVDILISFKDITIEKYTDNYFELYQKLQELFSRKIDLVTENSLSNPFLIESIEKTKQLVYGE